MTALTSEELAALRDLDARRTQGVWRSLANGRDESGEMQFYVSSERDESSIAINYISSIGGGTGAGMREADAAHIAAVCNAVPRLLATVEAQTVDLRRATAIADLAAAYSVAWQDFDAAAVESQRVLDGRGGGDDATRAHLTELSLARREAHKKLLRACGVEPSER